MEILVILLIAAVAGTGAWLVIKAVDKSKKRSTSTEPKIGEKVYYTPDVTEYTAPSSSSTYPEPVITDKVRDYTRPAAKAKPRSSSSSSRSYSDNSAATNAAIFGGSAGSYSSDSGSSYSGGSDSAGSFSGGGCDSGGGSF